MPQKQTPSESNGPTEVAATLSPSTRRVFLGVSIGAVLAACGSDDQTSQDTPDTAAGTDVGTADGSDSGDEFALVRYFSDPSITAGTDRRLALGLADLDGTLRAEGPDQLTGRLVDADGTVVGTLEGQRRDEQVALAYYEFRFDVPDTGIHTLEIELDGARAEASFTVAEPGSLPFAEPGEPMEPFETPTVDDAGGVDPICTREPACPFHDVTLGDALASDSPVVYLIGTPAFCQTATCGPILDLLIDVADDHGDITFVHAEVYADTTATTLAPAVEASQLAFEPAIFLIDAAGTVAERLDVVVDRNELDQRIGRIA